MSDHIEDFLESIARNLRGPVIESHHTLLETEDHLRSSAAALMRQGLSEDEAQLRAISQFGVAGEVAEGHNAEVGIFTFSTTLRSLAAAVTELVALGLIVIGISAVVAYVASLLTSTESVFGLPPGAQVTAEQCTYWLSIHPTAANCQQAGTWEAANDSTWLLGAIGLIGVALYLAVRRFRRKNNYAISAVPSILIPAIAGSIFFLASVGLLVFGQGNGVIESVWGRGRWYSESATSFAAFLVSTYFLISAIRRPLQKIHD